MRVLILLLMFLLPGLSQAQPGDDLFAPRGATQTDFLPVEKAFRFTWERLDDGQVQLRWQIAPGYYLYQKRLRFDGLDPALQPQLPPGESHSDEFFGESQVYRQSLELTLPAAAAGQLRLGWQGCADAGLCYPPQSQALDLGGTGPAAAVAGTSGEVAEDQGLAGSLQAGNLAWSLLLFFGLGLLLAFAPCSLPMLPILAGLVVGSGARPRRGLLLAGSYVLSMALVYAGLGVVAALLGGNLQAWLQQPWLLGSFAALFVFLALPMFGFFELQLPAALRDRLDGLSRGRKGGSLAGAAALGALSGLLVGPCMTAPLAGALLYIAQTGNALHGGLVLFSLGLGIGMPLLLLVTVGSRFLPKPGPWMNLVKGVFGFLFLGTAWILLRPLLGEALWIGLGGALLLVLAYAALHTARGLARHAVLFGAAGCIFGLWGAAMLLGAAAGADDPWRPLQVYAAANRGATPTASAHEAFLTVSQPAELDRQLAAAKAEGQWVLLDYYADWCVSCRIMEKQVFAKPDVLAALQGVRLLRLDVTADNAASRELLRRYQVPGPPSLIWIGPEGEERRARRLTGEVDAGGFLAHWQATRSAADAEFFPGAAGGLAATPAAVPRPRRRAARWLAGGARRRAQRRAGAVQPVVARPAGGAPGLRGALLAAVPWRLRTDAGYPRWRFPRLARPARRRARRAVLGLAATGATSLAGCRRQPRAGVLAAWQPGPGHLRARYAPARTEPAQRRRRVGATGRFPGPPAGDQPLGQLVPAVSA